jgi:hypothetical protein
MTGNGNIGNPPPRHTGVGDATEGKLEHDIARSEA